MAKRAPKRPDFHAELQSDVASAAEAIRRLPDDVLPAQLRAALSRELRRAARYAEPIWSGGYFMLSSIQAVAVWEAIWSLPNIARRNHVHRAFDLICAHVERDSCEILMTRDELARRIGTAPTHVTSIMATLRHLGVIQRTERRRVPGVRGPGEVVYFLNPHVAWQGNLDARKREAERVPLPRLKLVKGQTVSDQ